jgi:hypothetical protein
MTVGARLQRLAAILRGRWNRSQSNRADCSAFCSVRSAAWRAGPDIVERDRHLLAVLRDRAVHWAHVFWMALRRLLSSSGREKARDHPGGATTIARHRAGRSQA